MHQFPDDFKWGTATAAYQIEGAVREDGRGESIWDRFSHTPGKISDGTNGDIACDHYHLWPEDIKLMTELGVNAYRFSIAWPRILPNGKGAVNQSGLDFYSRLVDGLLEAGIEPAATLFHWDLPQALEEAGGWVNRDTAEYFEEYAGTVFRALSDRVRMWITHNEPWVVSIVGYGTAEHAPGLNDFGAAIKASHVLNLAHARAVRLFRNDFSDGGKIGITLNLAPFEPETVEDRDVAAIADGWRNRWFLDPPLRGRYPEDMTEFYSDRGWEVGIRD
ncbi:MAG: family 1 glycosylhydrolase, partial [Spirochaetaceae bacterium]|nr:family 1 glycosylhydrolase [Spirochaetaceae bacterium]